ncbi:MAG: DUF4118 domain-containing protein [Bradyrhizobiaceae bacterium]|nr:DUF4118 domain-containing protein [Bradyrhizobiaceae bacterium]
MSIDKSAFPIRDNAAGARLGGFGLSLLTNARPSLTKYASAAQVWMHKALAPGGFAGLFMAIAFVIGTDVFLVLMGYLQEMPPVTLSCLIPVVVAAIRWGTLSAMVTALGGATSLTYFLYTPFYVINSDQRSRVLGVLVFLTVALVLGYLAARIRRDTARAISRENEIRDLYTFSQRISAAQSPGAIFEAMQQHLESLVGRKILLFDSLGTLEAKSERLGDVEIPQAVNETVSQMLAENRDCSKDVVVDDHRGSEWLVRPVSNNTAEFGVIAVDLGHPSDVQELRTRVVAMIADAGLSLERLGLARTISEARTRAETEQFREALIGSVSHELRTPLSSILGASTVLSLAPEVTGNARLKKLAALIHQESERLNVEIENILDASRISSNGLQARLEWAEPADFVNAALQRCRNRLGSRTVDVALPDELILLSIDSVLMERALGQILDNAAKYSPPETQIRVRGYVESKQFVISVTDQGAGLDADDRTLLGQKFFRGNRHREVTSGLGLGYWIANAFVAANNGTIEAASEGVNKGMTVTVRLPLPMKENDRLT